MYPYPIIGQDYGIDNVFIEDLTISEDTSVLWIESLNGISMESIHPELKHNENRGNISFAMLITSNMAYYEYLVDVELGKPIKISIEKRNIATHVDLSILIYTKTECDIHFSNIDTSLPSSVKLPSSSFLGELCSFRFWLAHERKRSVGDIIRLDLNADNYSFDLDVNKITVKIPRNLIESYSEVKGNGNLIYALYVYPVLVQAMSHVLDYRSGENVNYEGLRWFEYLQMKIETNGINESNSIIATQELVSFNVQEEVIKMIYESSNE